jgi:glycosyltransferase involved in cell wall biosynthesis
MLKALALLPSHYKLFIAGDGKERTTFELMAQDLGVSERVYFAGIRKDAYRYLPYYDIYALPSRSEGFPISLLEAAAYGCKVVASQLPIVEECFSDEEIGIFEMPDERAMARAILKANDESGYKLNKAFKEKYSPDVFYNKYYELYLE